MKHTGLILIWAILFLFVYSGVADSSRPEPVVEKIGQVVHVTGDRVYLSLGRLDGITREWTIARIQGINDTCHVQISWIGEDLCRFDLDARMSDSLTAGDTVWLSKMSDQWDERKAVSVKWALTAAPTPLEQTPMTLKDWDIREAVLPHIGDFIDSIDLDITGSTVWHLKEYLSTSDSGREVSEIVCSSLKSLCSEMGPFAPFVEQFGESGDSLSCAEIAPYTVRTNLHLHHSQSRLWLNSPGFCCQSEAYVTGRWAPYRILNSSNRNVVLKANEYHSDHPIVDTVSLLVYDSYEAAKLAFELGEVDIVDIAPFDVFRFEDNYDVVSSPMASTVFLSVNNSKPYFSDNLFATALNYLVDKRSLCRVPLDGMVEPIDFPPVLDDPTISTPFRHNPGKGSKLLDQIDDLPLFMSLLVSDSHDPALLRIANYIQGLLRRHGISLTVYTDPFTDEQDVSSSFFESFDMMLAVLHGPSGTGEELLYQSWYHDDFAEIESNRSLFRSASMDELFAESYLSAGSSDADRERAKRKMISEHLNTPSGVWLYAPVRYTAISSKIISIEFLPSGIAKFSTIFLE